MSWKDEWKSLAIIVGGFLSLYYMPAITLGGRVGGAVSEALELAKWYAREHVILCLVPAFFIAGAITVFLRQESVLKYLGARANKVTAYGVASVSGSILAVCSCTILPLFAGIYKRGAGVGPALTFLYAGPAVNVLAIILTARVLGVQMGVARGVGAVVFSVVIGLLMHAIFGEDEHASAAEAERVGDHKGRSLWQDASLVVALAGVLVFANWGQSDGSRGVWLALFSLKWYATAAFAVWVAVMLVTLLRMAWWRVALAALPAAVLALVVPGKPVAAFSAAAIGLSVISSADRGDAGEWIESTWGLTKQIMPLLLIGVLLAGALLGRPGEEGLLPSEWVSDAVGGNSIGANLLASAVGAFMYFATLTEVPILQGLMGSGMGKGPALALLLAGPALSLPNMLVIRSVIGTRKTAVFVALVVVMATITGLVYGTLF